MPVQTADGRLPAPWATETGGEPTAGATRDRPTRWSRRSFVLGVIATGALAGCDLVGDRTQPSPSNELEPVLVGALDLIAAYQATISTHSTLSDLLTPLAKDHQAHADRLAEQLGRQSPSASGVPTAPPIPNTESGAKRLLAAMELAAHRTASAVTLSGPARAAELAAAVAACRATHVVVLR